MGHLSQQVSALDTLRAMETRPACVEALDELARAQARTPGWTATSKGCVRAAGRSDTIGYRSPKDCRRHLPGVVDRCWCAIWTSCHRRGVSATGLAASGWSVRHHAGLCSDLAPILERAGKRLSGR